MNKNHSILCVDDEPINLMLFEKNFEKKFTVYTAESGFEALNLLKSKKEINFVMSDMKMPGMSGIEFIYQAKKEFPNITYFILTGFDITEEIMDALKTNLIYRYFRKPYNIQEVEKAILDSTT